MKTTIALSMPSDHAQVRNIVGALSESNLDVYWDRTIPGSSTWKEATASALAARAVLLFGSEATTQDQAAPYADLAKKVIASGKAICVLLDNSDQPGWLSGCTTYDLTGWRGRASSLFMLDLIAGVKAKVAGLDPPLPRAARQLLIRRLYIGVPSAVAALALVIGLYRDLGADLIASPAEASAWSALRPGSCEDLRAFLSSHGDGVYASEGQALLASRRTVDREIWRSADRPIPVYAPTTGAAAARSEVSAKAAAEMRAGAEGTRLCQGLASASSAKVEGVRLRVSDVQCDRLPTGIVCSVGGEAICNLKERSVVTTEICGST